jgi:hypothetical protein
MNIDCLTNIYAFMQASQVVKLCKNTAVECFPKKVTLTGVAQIAEFHRWCGKFDTSRLQEVEFKMAVTLSRQTPGVIGRVPPSVKRLVIRDQCYSGLEIPDTVEELILEEYDQNYIDLPAGIKRLTLGNLFMGSIRTFPAGLEELRILCWGYPMFSSLDHGPRRLSNIPDTVRHLEIGQEAPVVIQRWPASLKTLVLPENHRALQFWLDTTTTEIPRNVSVTYKPLVLHDWGIDLEDTLEEEYEPFEYQEYQDEPELYY